MGMITEMLLLKQWQILFVNRLINITPAIVLAGMNFLLSAMKQIKKRLNIS